MNFHVPGFLGSFLPSRRVEQAIASHFLVVSRHFLPLGLDTLYLLFNFLDLPHQALCDFLEQLLTTTFPKATW